METHWIVVADSARARLYTRANKRDPLTERVDLVHPANRRHEGEQWSDQPGRSFDSAGQGRHSMEATASTRDHEARLFAKRIADLLDKERRKGHVASLTIVAPPAFLGQLRDVLDGECRKLVTQSIAKDLTLETTEVIHKRLSLLSAGE